MKRDYGSYPELHSSGPSSAIQLGPSEGIMLACICVFGVYAHTHTRFPASESSLLSHRMGRLGR